MKRRGNEEIVNMFLCALYTYQWVWLFVECIVYLFQIRRVSEGPHFRSIGRQLNILTTFIFRKQSIDSFFVHDGAFCNFCTSV